MSIHARSDDPLIWESRQRDQVPNPPEADTEADTSKDKERYLASINDAYRIVFDTLPDAVCPKPPPLPPREADTTIEQILQSTDPSRVPDSKESLQLPLSRTVSKVMERLEGLNQQKSGSPWFLPALQGGRAFEKIDSYRKPATEPSGFDLGSIPPLDGNADKAGISRPRLRPTPSSLSLCSNFGSFGSASRLAWCLI